MSVLERLKNLESEVLGYQSNKSILERIDFLEFLVFDIKKSRHFNKSRLTKN